MKNLKTKLLILFVCIFSFAVFAAVKTTFYGPIDLQNYRIQNVGTPTSSKDATTKTYVDSAYASSTNYAGEGLATKLNKSGGTMSGQLNMSGYRIYNLANPALQNDAATKAYVDSKIGPGASTGFQYFGLKKGSSFVPLYNFDNINASTGGWLKFTVLKQFTGYPCLYTENMDAMITNLNTTPKTYKVGETFKGWLTANPEAAVNTNGTVIVDAGNGVVGSFGVTFPPLAQAQFMVYIGSDLYDQNTAASLLGKFDGSDNVVVGITNISTIVGNVGVSIPKAKLYVNNGTRTTTWTRNGQSSQTAPLVDPVYINGKECVWGKINFGIDPSVGGVRWSFDILVAPGVTESFGQFYLYSN